MSNTIGKNISKNKKFWPASHIFYSTRNLHPSPKMSKKGGVHLVWSCHILLENPWKGDFSHFQNFDQFQPLPKFWPVPVTFCDTQKSGAKNGAKMTLNLKMFQITIFNNQQFFETCCTSNIEDWIRVQCNEHVTSLSHSWARISKVSIHLFICWTFLAKIFKHMPSHCTQ